MEDKKNIVIRLKCSAAGKMAEPDASPSKVITEWNIKRILLAMVGIVLFIVVLFFLFKPDTLNTDLQPITLVNMPVKKAPEKMDFLAQKNQSSADKEPTKLVPVETKPKVAQKIITQPKVEKKVIAAGKTAVASRPEKSLHITAESLHQQIAQLGSSSTSLHKRITKVTSAKKVKTLAKEATAKATKPLTKTTLTKKTKQSADGKITTIEKNDTATRYYRYPTTPN